MVKQKEWISSILSILKSMGGPLSVKIVPHLMNVRHRSQELWGFLQSLSQRGSLKIQNFCHRMLPVWIHRHWRLCSIIALGLGAVLSAVWFRTPASAPKRMFDREHPIAVEASPVHVGPLRKEMSVVGALRAHQRVVLHSEMQGMVENILVHPGEFVKKGQVLIELEHQKLDAQLKEAEAKVAQARTIHEKERYLLQKNAGKKITYAEALQTLRVAEAQHELVLQDLRRSKITAPFDGYTSIHDISPGTFITPNADLLTLVDMQKVWVDFRVPEQHMPYLDIGQSAEVRLDQQDSPHVATIRAIDPFVDPVTHSAQVRAELNHRDETLRPGLFARVTVPLHEIPQAIMVPESALAREGTEDHVMRVSEDRALKTLVVTGLRKEGLVEIVDGLTKDDVIITAGHQRVRDGQKVKILNAPQEGTSPPKAGH